MSCLVSTPLGLMLGEQRYAIHLPPQLPLGLEVGILHFRCVLGYVYSIYFVHLTPHLLLGLEVGI